MIAQIIDIAIDKVPGDRDHVRAQRVDAGNDALHVGVSYRRSDMDVGDLGDREAMQGGRQSGNRHIDPYHPGGSPRSPEAPCRHGQREHGHGQRAGGL